MSLFIGRPAPRFAVSAGILALFAVTGCTDKKASAPQPGTPGTAQEAAASAGKNVCNSSAPVSGIQDLDLAQCLATPELEVTPQEASTNPPVVLYLDRSASMHGFLDPSFPNTPTSYVRVLDRLVVGLQAKRAYSFGTKLQEVPVSTKNFETDGFYSDRNTHLQDALVKIAQDSQAASTHVIITDGRRAGAAAADQQYADMRQSAADWIAHGGTFVAAMSMARFNTVSTDPSGCRQGDAPGPQTCPLYAFAFVARGGEPTALNALSDVFEHFFAWPAPVVPGTSLRLAAVPSKTPVTLNATWGRTKAGAPIGRATAPAAVNVPLAVHVKLMDGSSNSGRMLSRSLEGQRTNMQMKLKALIAQPAASPWLEMNPATSIVTSKESDQTLSFVSRGESAPRSLIRLDLIPTGEPSWLSLVSATNATDVVHTYGIDRLFEGFRNQAKNDPKPMGRLFVVVN